MIQEVWPSYYQSIINITFLLNVYYLYNVKFRCLSQHFGGGSNNQIPPMPSAMGSTLRAFQVLKFV